MRLITEMPWLNIEQGIEIPTTTGRTVTVDFLDVRIEEMVRAGLIPGKAINGWYAELPDSGLVLTNDGVIRDPDPQFLQGLIRLPDNWWEYSYGLYRDRNVKASIKPRQEQGEQTQEELDKIEVASESLEKRLSRIFDRPLNEWRYW